MAKEKHLLDTNNNLHRDPITGEPGSHPVGTGVGATGGALAGAAAYEREPYYEAGRSYDDYAPAYELGWSGRAAGHDEFASVEPTLAREWEARRGASTLDWTRARPASQAAWERADRLYYSDEDSAIPAVDGPPLANDDVVDVINDLLETSRDGEYGFRVCAEEIEDAQLQRMFAARSAECASAAAQLVRIVESYGGQPAAGGTASGAMHRGWVHVKGAVGANSRLSILEESERGEDTAVARYRKALKQMLPAGVREIVEAQARGAQRNHDQIRDLRNAERAAR